MSLWIKEPDVEMIFEILLIASVSTDKLELLLLFTSELLFVFLDTKANVFSIFSLSIVFSAAVFAAFFFFRKFFVSCALLLQLIHHFFDIFDQHSMLLYSFFPHFKQFLPNFCFVIKIFSREFLVNQARELISCDACNSKSLTVQF